MSQKMHHIGHLVKSLEDGMNLYEEILDLTREQLLASTLGGAGIMQHPIGRLILIPIGAFMIELIEPDLTLDNEYSRSLKERGEGLCHIVILTEDFNDKVKDMKNKGFTLEELTLPDFFPGVTLRTCMTSAKETLGAPIEFVDVTNTPPLDKVWFKKMKELENSKD
jgi:4-hydroxyphenylpyruvate dioxygenase-like putative hemolysin